MSDNDFMRRQQDAVERMREMSRKAAESPAQPMPPIAALCKAAKQGKSAAKPRLRRFTAIRANRPAGISCIE